MNEEIKEILQTLEDSIFCKFDLHTHEKKKLLDYITNLQEENERLKKQITEYQDEIFARDNNWYDMQD